MTSLVDTALVFNPVVQMGWKDSPIYKNWVLRPEKE